MGFISILNTHHLGEYVWYFFPPRNVRPGTGPTLTPSIISCSVSQLTLRGSVGFRSH